jgi:hypothetical protein
MSWTKHLWNTAIGLGSAVVAAIPIVGSHQEHLKVVWPPIGSLATYLAPAAAVLTSATAIISASIKRTKMSKRRKALYVAPALFIDVLSILLYSYFIATYVREVDTPKDGMQYFTVGDERTPLAKEYFPHNSDSEILEGAGLTDGVIQQMWTPESVRRARLSLFISYLMVLLSTNFLTGWFFKSTNGMK